MTNNTRTPKPFPTAKVITAVTVILSVIALVLALAGPARADEGSSADLPKVNPATDRVTSTIINNDTSSAPVQRLDQDGNAVDAHDTDLKFFDGRYWLYGESYDCGYSIKVVGTPYCGFKVYSSSDLERWDFHGYVFDPSDWQSKCAPPRYGCYGIHVNYNDRTNKYVLWFNSYEISENYHVFTGNTPLGPWTEQSAPVLAGKIQAETANGNHFNRGDSDVAVLSDGNAYILYVDIAAGHTVVLEKLNSAFTSGTGETVVIAERREGLSLFSRDGKNYALFAEPCEYCGRNRVWYRGTANSDNPLEGWGPAVNIGVNLQAQQPFDVADLGNGGYLYNGERWDHLRANQAQSSIYYAPVRFNGDHILPLTNSYSVSVDIAGKKTQKESIPGQDVLTVDRAVGAYADVNYKMNRGQTFYASRYGTLTTLSIGLYKRGKVNQLNPVNGDVQIRVYAADSRNHPIGRPLYLGWIHRDSVGSSLKMVDVHPNIPVNWYTKYIVIFGSATTTGAYGFGYSYSNGYARGQSVYKTGPFVGGTWKNDNSRNSDLMVRTVVQ